MRFILWIFLLGGALGIPASFAQTKQASAIINSRSFGLEEALGFNGTLYFTTSDGRNNTPPLFEVVNGAGVVSEELRPLSQVAGRYETDYLVVDGNRVIQEYGYITFDLPTTDNDTNGLPDITQKNRSSEFNFLGNCRVEWPFSYNATVNGSFTRNAGSNRGFYNLSFGPPVNTTYSGTLVLPNMTGSISYIRSSGTMTFLVTLENGHSSATEWSGQTSFVVSDANTVSLPAFTLRNAINQVIQVQATILKRQARTYRGNLVFTDGLKATSWNDYLNWHLEIEDLNDSDGDGLPDLTDDTGLPPQIHSLSPGGLIHQGGNYTITAQVTGATPMTNRWYRNGILIQQTATPSLPISNAKLTDEGEYILRVSNSFGESASQTVSIDVNLLPSITVTQPRTNSIYTTPATVPVTVTSSDPDGAIQNVQLFVNGALVGTLPPGQNSWPLLLSSSGVYRLQAKATDNQGGTNVTGEVTFRVVSDMPKLSVRRTGDDLELQWPAYEDYVLQSSLQVHTPSGWTRVFGTATLSGTNYLRTLPANQSSLFFRLKKD